MNQVLLELRPSLPRLWFAVVVQGALGVLLLWVALAHPPADLVWRVFLFVGGGLMAWSAVTLAKRADRRLVLTREALLDSGGGEVCKIDQIRAVRRGVFSFKPARGFALILDAGKPRAWVPGLWWRAGRRVGVGGVTGAAETRLLAETIEALIIR